MLQTVAQCEAYKERIRKEKQTRQGLLNLFTFCLVYTKYKIWCLVCFSFLLLVHEQQWLKINTVNKSTTASESTIQTRRPIILRAYSTAESLIWVQPLEENKNKVFNSQYTSRLSNMPAAGIRSLDQNNHRQTSVTRWKEELLRCKIPI